jgi:excinuclease ABC subunit C
MLESLLDEIPQLGETRRAALLDRFGSVTAMRKATAEELASTPGIGATIATIIFNHLQSLAQSSDGLAVDGLAGVDMATGEILDT